MLGRKSSSRKRKRIFRAILLKSLLVIGVVGLIVGVGFYFFFIRSHRPLYISPLSNAKLNEIAQDNELTSFQRTLHEKKIEFDSVEASGSSYMVQLKKGGKVTFSTDKSISEQISSLQFILARLTMEGKLFSRLDLRFDKPVITIR